MKWVLVFFFQNESVKKGSQCLYFNEAVKSKCNGIRQLLENFFSREKLAIKFMKKLERISKQEGLNSSRIQRGYFRELFELTGFSFKLVWLSKQELFHNPLFVSVFSLSTRLLLSKSGNQGSIQQLWNKITKKYVKPFQQKLKQML